jgi:MFS family permease
MSESSLRYAGWRVVFACFIAAIFAWGFGFYGHSVFLAELRRLHGWPASLISGATTLYYLLGACLVIFVSDAIAKLGPRYLVLMGMASFAVAMTLLAFVTVPWQLYLAYIVMSFGWMGMSLGAITNILGLWFNAKRGMAISLALNGASFGGIVGAPALVFLTGALGFQRGLLVATAAMIVLMVPIAFVCIGQPPMPTALPGETGATPAPRWTRAMALRSATFWTISAPFALALLAQVGFLVHLVSILEPAMGRAEAGFAISILSVMAVIGRVGLGTIVDRLNQRLVTAVSLASQATALALMTQTSDPTALIILCSVFGFSVGNIITLPALLIQREFDSASFGLLIGLLTAINQFAYSLGPGLLGLVRDLSGGYTAALVLCIGLEIIAAAIILVQPAQRLSHAENPR